ncbi:MAG TPA: hypothetical protein VIG33_00960 [Pseudobdellovibrionaceae bacterium]|jgi:hypothetical protein
MKFKGILMTLFLSACVTNTTGSNRGSLNYDKVRSLVVGYSTESDVLAVLGLPTGRTEEAGYYILNYDDSKTGFQRLSINFLLGSQKLSGILWIPREDEKEYSLMQAKAGFKNADFKEIINRSTNPHAISPDEVSYIDEKHGVTIRYDRSQNIVEAIAMYDVNVRLPAATEKKNQIPYTFGDEPAISK